MTDGARIGSLRPEQSLSTIGPVEGAYMQEPLMSFRNTYRADKILLVRATNPNLHLEPDYGDNFAVSDYILAKMGNA